MKQVVPETERREQAVKTAEACCRLLKERFGARRVIVFGSLAGQGKWHERSDIDLAVEGMAAEQFFRAWASLWEILPPGVDVDLVPLEDVSPELRARILGEEAMPEDPLLALKGLVEDELMALQRIVEGTQEGLAHLTMPFSQFEMNALASYVHQFYTGCERMLERIAVHIDGEVPGEAFSHVNLLAQMARERSGVRPPVLDEGLWVRLQEYLAFRHFFRHAYGSTLEWARLRPLVEGMATTLAGFRGHSTAFFETMVRNRGE